MKFGAVLILALVYYFSPGECSFGETDVIRIFDPKLRMPRAQLRVLLAKADLVSAGFTKSEETQIVTGQDGKKRTKEVTYYTVQDACSNVAYWEEKIKVRLPTFSEKLTRKVVDEVEKRIAGRKTEYCRFGIEIHFNLCGHTENEKPQNPKRDQQGLANCDGYCACCENCGKTEIKYTSMN